MLSLAELDGKIALSRLDQRHRGVDPGFGVICGVKGADHFPLYQRGSGIHSNAKAGIDALMFHPTHEYDIKMARHGHGPVPNINPPYLSSNLDFGAPRDNTGNDAIGVMSRFYGLPTEKDIVIENFAAEATGLSKSKTPARDFMVSNLRANVEAEKQGFADRDAYSAFMKNPAVINLIAGGSTVAQAKTAMRPTAPAIRRNILLKRVKAAAAATPTPPTVVVARPFPTPTAAALSTALPDDDEPLAEKGKPEVKSVAKKPAAKKTGKADKDEDEGEDEGEDIEDEPRVSKKGAAIAGKNFDTLADISRTLNDELTSLRVAYDSVRLPSEKKAMKESLKPRLSTLATRIQKQGAEVGVATTATGYKDLENAMKRIDAAIQEGRGASTPRAERK